MPGAHCPLPVMRACVGRCAVLRACVGGCVCMHACVRACVRVCSSAGGATPELSRGVWLLTLSKQ